MWVVSGLVTGTTESQELSGALLTHTQKKLKIQDIIYEGRGICNTVEKSFSQND